VTLNPALRIAEAKRLARGAADAGFEPRSLQTFQLPGRSGASAFEVAIYNMVHGGYATEYEGKLGRKLANIICGGDIARGTKVTEQDLLDLEREAFLSLCGEPNTQARMQHMLQTGKPLRN
jgi:3-hydroxyacyl-CoA dehydrogenase